MQDVEVLIIGAGQAGLAMGQALGRRGIPYLLLDTNPRIGDSWRNRYESLKLFTPRFYNSLPDFPMQGDPEGWPSKDEVADYLEAFAKQFNIAVRHNTSVHRLTQTPDGFAVSTNQGDLKARKVVVATGPFQVPFTPQLEGEFSPDLYRVHSFEYRNPSELREGPVLVVGAQNSGVQIAAELIDKHDVYLSVGREMKYLPSRILGKNLFWWFIKLGISDITIDSKIGRKLSTKDPIIGKDVKPLIDKGRIKLCARTVGIDGTVARFADGKTLPVQNIIWATGYRDDFSWLEVPGAFDTAGQVVHKRGISRVPGLYFIGRVWQYRKGSAMLSGVGDDAEYLASHL